jgi:hypothetical protein
MAIYVRNVPEVEVRRDARAVRIHVPTLCTIADLAALAVVSLVILAALGAAGVVWVSHGGPSIAQAADALASIRSVDLSQGIKIVAVAVGWLLLCVAFLYIPAEMLAGREIVEVNSQQMVITRQIGFIEWEQTADVDQIRGIRDVEPPKPWHLRLMGYRPMWHGKYGRLEVMLKNGKRIRFGTLDPGTNLRLLRGTVNRELSVVVPDASLVEPVLQVAPPAEAPKPPLSVAS